MRLRAIADDALGRFRHVANRGATADLSVSRSDRDADRHETFCFDDRRRGDQGDETLEKGAATQNKIAHVYALLQFAHASESKDQLLPAWATSSFTTVAGQGWLAGHKALS